MRKTALTLITAFCILETACGPTYVQPVATTTAAQWDGDPCAASYFDAVACQTAINLGGWWLNGVLIHHSYGGYGYNYYAMQNHTYVLHGGRVTPYATAVHTVVIRPQRPQTVSSVSGAGKAYAPSQRPVAPANTRPYTPASRPASSYTPASRPSSSYSPSRRK